MPTLTRFALISATLLCLLLMACTSESEQMMSDCREGMPEYVEQMEDITDRWDDSMQIALSSARISLAEPVGDLQEIRRDADNINPPQCMASSHEGYVEATGVFVDALLDFMSDADAEPDQVELSTAQFSMLITRDLLETYNEDEEAFFVSLEENFATATAEAGGDN